MQIEVVDDQNCPRCSKGYNTEPSYPNRPKLEYAGVWWWRCYNPNCTAAYYDPQTGSIVEQKEDER